MQLLRILVCTVVYMLLAYVPGHAQFWLRSYTVKGGKMYIQLSKQLPMSSLDSFIALHDLYDLGLKKLMLSGATDSLKKAGWKVEVNNDVSCVITKPLNAASTVNNAADRLNFTAKQNADMFAAVSSGVQYGVNRFRNKYPFDVNGQTITFYLRNNLNANRVMLAGSFNNWSPDALPMKKTDSGWIAFVKLKPGKYWYKFIPDGHWTTDADNLLSENDGEGNTNSVFFVTNTVFTFNGSPNAKRVYVSGSFNKWRPSELQMFKTPKGWQLPVYLADGTHTYRYVADRDWFTDPDNKDRLPNEFNDFNSVIRIGKPHIFKLNGYTNAKKVILAGSFNKWREDELYMEKTSIGWQLPYTLGPGNYAYRFLVDGKWVTDTTTANDRGKTGNSYLVLEPNYTFRLKGYEKARSVFLAGDFNDWSPNSFAMRREGDSWVFSLRVSPGKCRYKFVVDGNWIIDPGNKLWEQNEFGTGNSIIWIESK